MKKFYFYIFLIIIFLGCSSPKNSSTDKLFGEADTTPPTISIVSPEADSFVSGYVEIVVQAIDDKSGIEKVEFYIDNSRVSEVFYNQNPKYLWNTDSLDGIHTIKIIAYDMSGNKSEKIINVTVNNFFYILGFKNNEDVFGNYLLISCYKSSSLVSTSVKFYYNSDLIGEDNNLSDGISIRWNTTTVTNGTYTIKAELYNNSTKVTEYSIPVNVNNRVGYANPTIKSMYEMTYFGSNPGNLRMFFYVPSSMDNNPRGLILVLHGCSQDAVNMAKDMEWNEKAEAKKFYVVYPQQKTENHVNVCFNWFTPAHQMRGYGEPESIKQMIEKMRASYNIDSNKIYIVGFSAGGCMANVIGATYPDIIKGIGSIAGIPYKVASDVSSAGWAMDGQIDKLPSELANLIREGYQGYSGSYSNFIGFQGVNDTIVDKKNLQELMEQWTEINGITTRSPSDPCSTPGTYTYGTKVKTYCISGMGHAVPVTNGTGKSSYVYITTIDATTEMLNYWGF
ncbi:MAG TPA: PHB depolymerase family esterase [Spirochaetota bacterium]|nr:PHB depolymerase family esterase [Spirochaetota bacterium]